MTFAPGYKSIVWTAAITGVFSAIVGVGLAVNYFGQQVGRQVDQQVVLPMDDPQYVTLKERIEADAGNRELQEQIRALDVKLREDYFRRLTFARRGAYLLGVGLAATMLLAHWALTVRRRLPKPKPVITAQRDFELRHSQLAQVAAGTLIVLLASIVAASRLASPNILPDSSPEPDTVAQQIPRQPDATEVEPRQDRTPTAPADAPSGDLDAPPTSEQVAANWPRFRGPHGAGVSAFTDVPETWDGTTGEGILWKTPIELPGASSAIVWGDRVFLTGATPERREVYCVDTNSGELLWQKPVAENAQGKSEIKVDESTGYAAPTPTTDGQRVFAIFASGDLVAFDFEGNQVWSHDFGVLDNPYGHATSLTTCKDLLIVQVDQGLAEDAKSKLLALRTATGDVAWEAKREVPSSWATPIVVEHQGLSRIITCGEPWVIAYAADDGREIWRAKCMKGDVGPSPVYAGGVVYVANDNAMLAAIRDGGEGDVTESHVIWSARIGMPDICSPLATDKFLLLIPSYGGLVSYNREQGGEEPLWEEELDVMPFASPSLVGDRVYLIGDDGAGLVVKPTDSGIEHLAENQLGERCFASPAFQPGRIYLRGQQHLFCIGRK